MTTFYLYGEVKSTEGGKKKKVRMQKEMRLKMHNTPFHPPSPHANLSSIIQHKRDNRQTARGHLQRAGCQGRPVERAKACPHQSPAAVGEPQRCSFPWGCSEIQRWRIKLELAISSGQLCTLLQGRHKREGLGYFNPSLHPFLHSRYLNYCLDSPRYVV